MNVFLIAVMIVVVFAQNNAISANESTKNADNQIITVEPPELESEQFQRETLNDISTDDSQGKRNSRRSQRKHGGGSDDRMRKQMGKTDIGPPHRSNREDGNDPQNPDFSDVNSIEDNSNVHGSNAKDGEDMTETETVSENAGIIPFSSIPYILGVTLVAACFIVFFLMRSRRGNPQNDVGVYTRLPQSEVELNAPRKNDSAAKDEDWGDDWEVSDNKVASIPSNISYGATTRQSNVADIESGQHDTSTTSTATAKIPSPSTSEVVKQSE